MIAKLQQMIGLALMAASFTFLILYSLGGHDATWAMGVTALACCAAGIVMGIVGLYRFYTDRFHDVHPLSDLFAGIMFSLVGLVVLGSLGSYRPYAGGAMLLVMLASWFFASKPAAMNVTRILSPLFFGFLGLALIQSGSFGMVIAGLGIMLIAWVCFYEFSNRSLKEEIVTHLDSTAY